jgi:hypothetical protein
MRSKVMAMQRLSDKVNRSNFDFLLRIVLDMTAGCSRDQLMELADRLHERRRQMDLCDPPRDNDDLAFN